MKRPLVRMLWLHLLVYLASVAPLFLAVVPPLIDYPDYLAHTYIMFHYDTSPFFQQNYLVRYAVVPHSAMEFAGLVLLHFMDIFMLGKLFLAFSLLLIAVGVLGIHYALYRRLSPLSFLLYPFLYNACLTWGFTNYLFGSGMALCLFALWLFGAAWRPALRMAVLSAGAVVVFFSHLVCVGVLGLLIFLYEQSIRRPFKERIMVCLQLALIFLPCVLLWLLVPKAHHQSLITSGFLLAIPNFKYALGFNSDADIWALGSFLGFMLLGFILGTLHMPKRLAIFLGLMAYVALLVPDYVLGVWKMSIRLPWIICLLLIAFSAPHKKKLPTFVRMMQGSLLVFMIGVFGVRHAAIAQTIYTDGKRIEEARQAFSAIKKGSILLPLQRDTDYHWEAHDGWYWHVAALAIIDREVFLPTLMTGISFIHPAERYAALENPYRPVPPKLFTKIKTEPQKWGFLKDWRHQIDYVMWFHFDEKKTLQPVELKPIHEGSYFTLYCNAAAKDGPACLKQAAHPKTTGVENGGR